MGNKVAKTTLRSPEEHDLADIKTPELPIQSSRDIEPKIQKQGTFASLEDGMRLRLLNKLEEP